MQVQCKICSFRKEHFIEFISNYQHVTDGFKPRFRSLAFSPLLGMTRHNKHDDILKAIYSTLLPDSHTSMATSNSPTGNNGFVRPISFRLA